MSDDVTELAATRVRVVGEKWSVRKYRITVGGVWGRNRKAKRDSFALCEQPIDAVPFTADELRQKALLHCWAMKPRGPMGFRVDMNIVECERGESCTWEKFMPMSAVTVVADTTSGDPR